MEITVKISYQDHSFNYGDRFIIGDYDLAAKIEVHKEKSRTKDFIGRELKWVQVDNCEFRDIETGESINGRKVAKYLEGITEIDDIVSEISGK